MEKREINVSVTLDVKDIFKIHIENSKNRFPSTFKAIFALAALTFIAISCYASTKTGILPYDAMVLVATILFFAVGVPLNLKNRAKKDFEESAALQTEHHYRVDHNSITAEGQSGKSTFRWDQIYKASNVKGYFIIYASKKEMFIMPKASFKSEEDIKLITNYIDKFAPVPNTNESTFMKLLRLLGLLYIIFFFVSYIYTRFIK